jgi:hypothetical protein
VEQILLKKENLENIHGQWEYVNYMSNIFPLAKNPFSIFLFLKVSVSHIPTDKKKKTKKIFLASVNMWDR